MTFSSHPHSPIVSSKISASPHLTDSPEYSSSEQSGSPSPSKATVASRGDSTIQTPTKTRHLDSESCMQTSSSSVSTMNQCDSSLLSSSTSVPSGHPVNSGSVLSGVSALSAESAGFHTSAASQSSLSQSKNIHLLSHNNSSSNQSSRTPDKKRSTSVAWKALCANDASLNEILFDEAGTSDASTCGTSSVCGTCEPQSTASSDSSKDIAPSSSSCSNKKLELHSDSAPYPHASSSELPSTSSSGTCRKTKFGIEKRSMVSQIQDDMKEIAPHGVHTFCCLKSLRPPSLQTSINNGIYTCEYKLRDVVGTGMHRMKHVAKEDAAANLLTQLFPEDYSLQDIYQEMDKEIAASSRNLKPLLQSCSVNVCQLLNEVITFYNFSRPDIEYGTDKNLYVCTMTMLHKGKKIISRCKDLNEKQVKKRCAREILHKIFPSMNKLEDIHRDLAKKRAIKEKKKEEQRRSQKRVRKVSSSSSSLSNDSSSSSWRSNSSVLSKQNKENSTAQRRLHRSDLSSHFSARDSDHVMRDCTNTVHELNQFPVTTIQAPSGRMIRVRMVPLNPADKGALLTAASTSSSASAGVSPAFEGRQNPPPMAPLYVPGCYNAFMTPMPQLPVPQWGGAQSTFSQPYHSQNHAFSG